MTLSKDPRWIAEVVVEHDVPLAARVGLGDVFEDVQELGVAVPLVSGR